jgi:hypothetical protein
MISLQPQLDDVSEHKVEHSGPAFNFLIDESRRHQGYDRCGRDVRCFNDLNRR